MSIIGGNAFYDNVLKGMNRQQDISLKNSISKIRSGGNSVLQSARQLVEEIHDGAPRYDMAAENVDLSAIWQRARDWGLDEQQKMLNRARELGVRASDSFLPESARKIVNMELDSLKAETTRIGLTNSINGSNTLSRVERVETVEEVEEEVEKTEKEELTEKPTVDVVWVMDRSTSMAQHYYELKEYSSEMFKVLEKKGFNVRMAARGFIRKLDDIGSTNFTDNVEEFRNDVQEIIDRPGGIVEKGLLATQQATQEFENKFSKDSTKVMILITDENSDDFHNVNEYDWLDTRKYKNNDMDDGKNSEQFRQSVADSVSSLDSYYFVVGSTLMGSNMPDMDYQDVVNKVNKGESISLKSDWLNNIADHLVAIADKVSIERNYVYKNEGVVVNDKLNHLDEWDINFQVGNTSSDKIVETFKTSTAKTSGLINADFSTAEKARESFGALDNAADFLSTAHTQVGTLQNRFYSIANDIAIKSINEARPFKLFPDAIGTYLNASVFSMLRNAV